MNFSGLVVAPAEKASLLGSLFDSNQCREQFAHLGLVILRFGAILWHSALLSFCVCFVLLTYAYGGVDPLWVFPLFLKMVPDIIGQKLSIIFRWLMGLGSFPECWRSANVTAIPKGAPSPDRENYHHISITPILSKVYDKSVSHKLSSFWDKYVFFCLLLSLLLGKV